MQWAYSREKMSFMSLTGTLHKRFLVEKYRLDPGEMTFFLTETLSLKHKPWQKIHPFEVHDSMFLSTYKLLQPLLIPEHSHHSLKMSYS